MVGGSRPSPRSLEERIKYYTQMSCKISYIMYFLFNTFRQIIYLRIADLQCCVYILFFPSFHCGNKDTLRFAPVLFSNNIASAKGTKLRNTRSLC